MNSHKQDVISSAIEGLVNGGMSILEAKNLAFLLECIYNCGYNEAKRQMKENPTDWGAYR